MILVTNQEYKVFTYQIGRFELRIQRFTHQIRYIKLRIGPFTLQIQQIDYC